MYVFVHPLNFFYFIFEPNLTLNAPETKWEKEGTENY